MSKIQIISLSIYITYVIYSIGASIYDINRPIITLYDVGQGDSSLLTYKNINILIDGGPDNSLMYEISKNFSLTFLNNCHVDYVILSHYHADHYEGLLRLLEWCRPNVIFTFDTYDMNSDHKFNIFINALDIKHEVLKEGDSINFLNGINTKFTAQILWPGEKIKNIKDSKNVNNYSGVVLFITDFSEALFTGDAESRVYDLIDSNVVSKNIFNGVEIIKVPHQGSKDSLNKNFYNLINPKICVISVGKNNYGHPSKEVLGFLSEIGCDTFRTDEQGSLEFKLK